MMGPFIGPPFFASYRPAGSPDRVDASGHIFVHTTRVLTAELEGHVDDDSVIEGDLSGRRIVIERDLLNVVRATAFATLRNSLFHVLTPSHTLKRGYIILHNSHEVNILL
jgi:hypothetical protein